jgi:hypothetical protein
MSLLYKLYYMKYYLKKKTRLTLSSTSSGKLQPHRQSTGGQHTPLEEVFIIEVHLIFSF